MAANNIQTDGSIEVGLVFEHLNKIKISTKEQKDARETAMGNRVHGNIL